MEIGINPTHLPKHKPLTDEELKNLGMTHKPLGQDYKQDDELAHIINTVFKFQGGFAAFGTLLGLVRDGHLIWDNDTDVDFYFTPEKIPATIGSIERSMEVADIVRAERTYVTLRTKKHGRFVDFYLCHMIGDRMTYMPDPSNWTVGGAELRWNTSMIDGRLNFWIPNNPHHCLTCWYGPRWMIKKTRKEFFNAGDN